MKSRGSTPKLHLILPCSSTGEEIGIYGVAVKCVDIVRKTSAKANLWTVTDTEARRPGEQTGLDTLVVLAVNGARLVWEDSAPSVPELTR